MTDFEGFENEVDSIPNPETDQTNNDPRDFDQMAKDGEL